MQFLHAAVAASGKTYRRPTLAIACSPLDAEQTVVMIARHDRLIANFLHTERLPLSKHYQKDTNVPIYSVDYH